MKEFTLKFPHYVVQTFFQRMRIPKRLPQVVREAMIRNAGCLKGEELFGDAGEAAEYAYKMKVQPHTIVEFFEVTDMNAPRTRISNWKDRFWRKS